MRKIVAAVIAVLIAAGAWWYASPLWTLHALQDAAKQHDAERLSEYVDYPALRESLKLDLRQAATTEASRQTHGAATELGTAVTALVVGPMVDRIVTPAGVEAMFAADEQYGAASKLAPVSADDHPVVEREGLNSFKVHGKDTSKGALVFHRHGLGWKLAGVDLPQH